MKKTEAIRAITTAFCTLDGISHENELKKHNLSLSDYNAARDIFRDLSTPGSTAKTLYKSVAEFYARAGFTVTESGISYTITTA